MRNHLWWLHALFIAFFTLTFLLHERGARGELQSAFFHRDLYPIAHRITAFFTDLKFRVRGPTRPRNQIVIVEVDSPSIEALGRWPWPRDYLAELIEQTYAAGAKYVGLDIIFSEAQQAIPEELQNILNQRKLGHLTADFDFDRHLTRTIARHRDHLVLAWGTESVCRPAFESAERCPVLMGDPNDAFFKFAVPGAKFSPLFDYQRTPVLSAPTTIANIDRFNVAASHAGFVNDFRDADGLVRRTSLLLLHSHAAFMSLPLEMARMAKGKTLEVSFGPTNLLSELKYAGETRAIPIPPSGMMDINFRGAGRTFPYVSALDVLQREEGPSRKIASEDPLSPLKDSFALIGMSALALSDIAAMPFDPVMPGVEFHATALDNLLSGDMLLASATSPTAVLSITLLMILGAIVFSWAAEKLEAYPALFLFGITLITLLIVDQKLLFENNHNWNTGFLYLELAAIAMTSLAAKYIQEENRKKFLRTAFSKYVAPAVVDSLLSDPKKLSLGGTRQTLTILFSDIRGFTTISETMDAKKVAQFLNDYLGIMTDIVFTHGGTLDKYIGDAVMAFWGAPLNQEDHAKRAVTAAVEMMKAVATHRQRFLEQYGVKLNIGVGINTGIANVGNMGSERSFGYTAIGDSVNLASRLESATKFYGVNILVSGALMNEIQRNGGATPEARSLGLAKLKGKENSVEIFHVFHETLSPEGLRHFKEGRERYDQHEWDAAIQSFELANQCFGGQDGPSRAYLERCLDLKKRPPKREWDGSWSLSSI